LLSESRNSGLGMDIPEAVEFMTGSKDSGVSNTEAHIDIQTYSNTVSNLCACMGVLSENRIRPQPFWPSFIRLVVSNTFSKIPGPSEPVSDHCQYYRGSCATAPNFFADGLTEWYWPVTDLNQAPSPIRGDCESTRGPIALGFRCPI
jgi:hypothetical protein